MAISEAYTGTATISTTEISLVSGTSTLQSIATPGVIQVYIDVTNMLAGDEYIIKVKDKVTSSSAQLSFYTIYLDGKQTVPFVMPSIILMHGWDVTMQLQAGTARSITWSIRKAG